MYIRYSSVKSMKGAFWHSHNPRGTAIKRLDLNSQYGKLGSTVEGRITRRALSNLLYPCRFSFLELVT